jgi:hypothetical protein
MVSYGICMEYVWEEEMERLGDVGIGIRFLERGFDGYANAKRG